MSFQTINFGNTKYSARERYQDCSVTVKLLQFSFLERQHQMHNAGPLSWWRTSDISAKALVISLHCYPYMPFSLLDDPDFHNKDCCFFSTLYLLTHISVPLIISSLKCTSTSACWKEFVFIFHQFSFSYMVCGMNVVEIRHTSTYQSIMCNINLQVWYNICYSSNCHTMICTLQGN
jgi:hypothetical protein